MTDDFFSRHLSAAPVIAILRGLDTDRTIEAARACWSRGIRLVEVPMQDEESRHAIARLAAEPRSGNERIGAGTICTEADVHEAAELGAEFLVAPGVFPEALRAAGELGLPLLPGVFTPTEIRLALSLGATTQKLFPADGVGPRHLAALRGPFPDVQFCAVGGITAKNARLYLSHGASSVGVGTALLQPGALESFAQLIRPPHTAEKGTS